VPLLSGEPPFVQPGGSAKVNGRAHRDVESNCGERADDRGNVAGRDINNEPQRRQRFLEFVDRRRRDCIAGHLVCEKDSAKLAGKLDSAKLAGKLDSASGKRPLAFRHLERRAAGIQGQDI